ncbi:hypothetical protein ACRN9G_11605 [Shewanella frigidimarina]|uniref:hypothetical protein n=1 Tax=Shewanella frigidimarina TaxID=56812 RepID=UPI003D7B2E92
MRVFSSFEKQLLTKMIDLDQSDSLNVLGNLLDTFYGESHLPEHCHIKLISETEVDIYVKTDELNQGNIDLKNVDYDVSKKLLGVIALFEYLEKQKLAYFMGENDFKTLGMVYADANYTACDFLDNEVKPQIYKYSKKRIFVSETLKVLVENSFRTDEEIRHDKEVSTISKQLKFTQFALVTTVLGLVISIMVPILVTSDIDIKNDIIVTELNEKTITETRNLIKQGVAPLTMELVRTQAKLTEVSTAIKQANKDHSLSVDRSSQVISAKLDELSKSLTESVKSVEKSLVKSHNTYEPSTSQ